jgi:hypothetical protein
MFGAPLRDEELDNGRLVIEISLRGTLNANA